MSTPIILVCGPAGSGKDTVANMVAEQHGGICIALADPIKRFAGILFGFDENQLWGPSDCRNRPDDRFVLERSWFEADDRLNEFGSDWVEEIGAPKPFQALDALQNWFDELSRANWKRPITPRLVLQTLGTEFGRAVDSDLWLNLGLANAKHLLTMGGTYERTLGLMKKLPKLPPEFVLITDGRFRNEMLAVHGAGGYVLKINSSLGMVPNDFAAHQSESELTNVPDHFFDYVVFNDKSRGLPALERMVKYLVRDIKDRATRFVDIHDVGG